MMEKKNGAYGFFDDGLTYVFPKPIMPEHITFMVRTPDADGETCDIRLYSVKPREEEETEAAAEED